MRGTIERIAVFLFLPLSAWTVSIVRQKSGVLSKSTEAEPPAFGPANSNTASLTAARNPPRIDSGRHRSCSATCCAWSDLFAAAVPREAGQRIKELVQNVDRFTGD